MEQTIDTLAVRVDKLERDAAELFDKTNTSAVSLAAVNEKLNSMLVTLGELKQAVVSIQSAPAKRLDGILTAVITAVISCLVGYLFAKLL